MGIKERKEREKQLRKQQILEAAKKVFSSKGYNNTTMEEIANEAELSPGTLYLYFKSKEELNASISIEVLRFLDKKMNEVSAMEELNSLERLKALEDALYDVYKFDPQTLLNVFQLQAGKTLQNLSPEILNEIKKSSRNSVFALAKICEDGIKEGIFINRHPIALADVIWSTFSGVIIWEDSKKILNDEKNFLKQTLKVAFEIIARGITK